MFSHYYANIPPYSPSYCIYFFLNTQTGGLKFSQFSSIETQNKLA